MDLKISELNSLTTPTNSDLIPIVNSGETKKITYLAFKNSLSYLSGTTNRIGKFTPDGTHIGDSILYDDGVNVKLNSSCYITSEDDADVQIYLGQTGNVRYEVNVARAELSNSYISMTPALANIGTESGYFLADSTSTKLVHDNMIDIEASIINLTPPGSGTINYGSSGDTHHYAGLTASRVPYINASNNLVVSAVTDTELGYLSGVTSSIQTQINSLQTGQFWKAAVRVATTTAGTLATSFENGDTIDGVVLATGDRILLKDQADPTENGIRIVAASGAPARATDFDAQADNLSGATVAVQEGTVNAEHKFTCSTNNPITIGVTNITFVDAGGLAYLGTTNRISISGNTIDISSSYVGQSTITTLGTVTTGVWTGSVINQTYGGTGVSNAGTLTNASNTTITGGGTLALGGFTLTVPATGTAILGTGTSTQVGFWTGTNTHSGDNSFVWNNTNKALLFNSAAYVSEHIGIFQAANSYGINTKLNTLGYAGFKAYVNNASTGDTDNLGAQFTNNNTGTNSSIAFQLNNSSRTNVAFSSYYTDAGNGNYKLSVITGTALSGYHFIDGTKKATGIGYGVISPVAAVHMGHAMSAASWGLSGIQTRVDGVTYTDTSGAGSASSLVANSFGAPNFAATNARTITHLANLYAAAPTAGTNVTNTNLFAGWFAGNVCMDGFVSINKQSVNRTASEALDIIGNIALSGQAYNPIYTITWASTITPDWNNSAIQLVTLAGATTTVANPSNIKNGAIYMLYVYQDASAPRLITWGSKYKFPAAAAPTLSSSNGQYDILTFSSDGTNLNLVGITNNLG